MNVFHVQMDKLSIFVSFLHIKYSDSCPFNHFNENKLSAPK
jgi:hypothetical protein